MPYSGISDAKLPPAVKKLPKHLREVWVRVFNENYDEADEGKSFRIAWGAVRKIQSAKEARTMLPNLSMDDVRAMLHDKAMRTDGGMEYGMGAYLYTPDRNKPSGWKLRVEESPGKVTVAQLGRAAAALGNNYRGHEAEMPAAARQACARKLIGLYHAHGVDDRDIPPYLWSVAGMRRPGAKELHLPAGFFVSKQADGSYRWTMLSSGAFEDRDQEIMSTAFLESALAFAKDTGYRGDLTIWHKNAAAIGDCDHQWLVGSPPLLLETGPLYDTPAGRAAAVYYAEHASEKGGSIEFLAGEKSADGVYGAPGVIVRRSVLPREWAAFPWSGFAVKEQKMDEKRQAIVAEFAGAMGISAEDAEKMLTHLESGSKELVDWGIRWKESDAVEAVAEPVAEPAPTGEVAEMPAAAAATTEPIAAEPPAAPLAQEVIIAPEAMTTIVEQVKGALQEALAKIDARVNELAQTIVTLGEQQLAVTAATKELQGTVADLKKTDDEKTQERVKNLPRAVVKAMQTPIERPTQRPVAPEAAPADTGESSLERMRKTLYG